MTTEERKTIGNVNVLDLRNATAETLDTIGRIGKVNILVHSDENAGLISRLNIGNINCSVAVRSDVELRTVMGHVRINREYFDGVSHPLSLLVMGHVIVEPGTTAEAIDRGLDSLIVMGHIACPEPLVGVVQSKVRRVMGHVRPYPATARLFPGGIELDVPFLESLDDGTELAVLGEIRLVTDVPDALIARKIGKLYAYGSCICREESVKALRARAVDGPKHVTVIPAGHDLIEDALTLDRATLATLADRKLYCTQTVTVDDDVTAADLDGRLTALACEGIVLCPESLEAALGAICDLLENRVVFYRGELLVFDGEDTLRASRLEYVDGVATAFVTGDLTIDPDLPAKLIAERFDRIHNLGDICCTAEQMGAIEARLGLHDGELIDASLESAPHRLDIGNANILTL